MIIIIQFICHWYLSLFTQSFFHHRYASHQDFEMSPRMEKVFIFLSGIAQNSSYLSALVYGIMHRLHHAHADTRLDPHPAALCRNIFEMMWIAKVNYMKIRNGTYDYGDEDVEKLMKNLPDWPAFEKIVHTWWCRIFWAALFISLYVLYATQWWMFVFLLPLQLIMGPFHGAIINWFAHKVGERPYKLGNTSTNLSNFFPNMRFPIKVIGIIFGILIAIIMLGESWHNNHHKFPGRYNFGRKWYQVDPIAWVVMLFNKVKIIQLPIGLKTN